MTRFVLIRLAAIATVCVLGACSTTSSPELVALKDASVYSVTQTELVDVEDRVEIAIGGVRVVEGGALIDVIMSVRPERRDRIDKALEIITGVIRSEELRHAKHNLEWAATVNDPVRITGADGPVRLERARLNHKDPEANDHGGMLFVRFVAPKSAEFNSNGRTYVVQPVAVATRSPLTSGEYTVELTEQFMWSIVRPEQGEAAPPFSARVQVEAPPVLPSPSLIDF